MSSIRSRNWALTLNLGERSIEDYVSIFETLPFAMKGYAIGAIEEGELNGYVHAHALICFDNAINFDSLQSLFLDIHLEPVNSKKNYLQYMSKTGKLLVDTLGFYNDAQDIYEDIVNCDSIQDFFRLHPELLNRFTMYERAFSMLNKNYDDKRGAW